MSKQKKENKKNNINSEQQYRCLGLFLLYICFT